MRTIRWQPPTAILATLAITGVALASTGAPASAGTADPGSVSSQARISDQAWAAGRAKFGAKATAGQALAAYWTPERQRAARSIGNSKAYLAALEKFQRAGKPADQPDRVGPAQSVVPNAGKIKTDPAGGMNRAHNPDYPYWHPTARTNGKVFFDGPGGSGYQCSASIINSEGRDTVWTAGHCVHQGAGGGWYWNWTFIPSYDDDLANWRPYGTWWATQLWTRTAWVNNSDFSQDFAVAIMGTLDGWHIVDYFGGQGLRANWGHPVWINAFGYPAEPPFDGGNLWQCWGWTEWEWAWATTRIPCDFNRGASGGPWLHDWNGEWGYLNGVNSRANLPNPTHVYSPYFDNDAWDLYNATRNL